MADAPEKKRKQFLIDARVLAAVESLAGERGWPLNALAEDALREYLKKLGRPLTLRDALKSSVRTIAANDRGPKTSPPANPGHSKNENTKANRTKTSRTKAERTKAKRTKA